jgi:hypothetical protein
MKPIHLVLRNLLRVSPLCRELTPQNYLCSNAPIEIQPPLLLTAKRGHTPRVPAVEPATEAGRQESC